MALVSLGTLSAPSMLFAGGVSYDGGEFSQIPVIRPDSKGSYIWNLLDPSTQQQSLFTTGLGKTGDRFIIANWLYRDVTSAGVVHRAASGDSRMIWTIRTKLHKGDKVLFQTISKPLGRNGDLAIAGGDFDGDGFADALIVKNVGGNWKWGLRADFFLKSYNPSLNINRAYFNFGRVGTDKPFFMRPGGNSDWFALLSGSDANARVTLQQPFARTVRTIDVGAVPNASNVPIPVRQDDGTDLMAFYGVRGGNTVIVFKDLSGHTVQSTTIPLVGDITTGD